MEVDTLNSMSLGIIIPVYNSALFLEECVTSVRKVSCREIILVDDGSTDGSSALCDALAKLDRRIRVIHQSNAGPGVARNVGIQAAQSDYLLFVDSDDWIDEKAVKMLFDKAMEKNLDVIQGEFIGLKKHLFSRYREYGEVYTGHEYLNRMIKYRCYDIVPVLKMVRCDYVRSNILYFGRGCYEDHLYTVKLFSHEEGRVSRYPVPFYFYRRNPSGITGFPHPSKLSDIINAANSVKDFIETRSDLKYNFTDCIFSFSIYEAVALSARIDEKQAAFFDKRILRLISRISIGGWFLLLLKFPEIGFQLMLYTIAPSGLRMIKRFRNRRRSR